MGIATITLCTLLHLSSFERLIADILVLLRSGELHQDGVC